MFSAEAVLRAVMVATLALALLPTMVHAQPGELRDIVILEDSHAKRHLFGGLEPVFAKIIPGTTVRWTNEDSVKHTLDVSFGEGNDTEAVFNASLWPGDTVERELTAVGNYTVASRDYPANVVGKVQVLKKEVDTEPPEITWPLSDGDAVVTPIIIVATDDIDVVRVELRVDGELLMESVPFPYFVDLVKEGVPAGTRVLEATAYDLSGKSGAGSVTIRLGAGSGGSVPWMGLAIGIAAFGGALVVSRRSIPKKGK